MAFYLPQSFFIVLDPDDPNGNQGFNAKTFINAALVRKIERLSLSVRQPDGSYARKWFYRFYFAKPMRLRAQQLGGNLEDLRDWWDTPYFNSELEAIWWFDANFNWNYSNFITLPTNG